MQNKHMPIEQIKKRNGEVVEFDRAKIERAISKANAATSGGMSEEVINAITDQVIHQLEEMFPEAVPGVEDTQDIVEKKIAEQGFFTVAKSYILYREQQKQKRREEQEELIAKMKSHKIMVQKRDGSSVPFDVNEITDSITSVCGELHNDIAIDEVVRDAMRNLYTGVTTKDITLAVIMALRARIERDPAYSQVAARFLINDLYREVLGVHEVDDGFQEKHRQGFSESIERGILGGRLDPRMREFDLDRLAGALDAQRDKLFQYLGAQTLYDRYFMRDLEQNIMETPQYFWMRMAMGLSLNEENKEASTIEFYNVASQLYYVPSTPTNFHSGTTHPQMSSCYLTTVNDDLTDIFKSIGDNAQLSKWSGGLGGDWTNIRATGALIKSTNVGSQGVVPFLKIVDATTAAINRSGKRRGATCVYLETWHYDIEDFLELRKNTGDERRRTHDTNTANWVPDLFMKRVVNDGEWTLFSPEEVPDLHHIYGQEFERKYEEYERAATAGKIALFKKVRAQVLWRKMVTMLFETGHPWMTFKDPCNIRSPQDHVGVVHSSNLCTEITLNTSADETAVCNLGSVNLPRHVVDGHLDRERLKATIHTAMRMLDNVIDLNYYPTKESQNANRQHRPVGLGIMGLQDALYTLGLAFDSDQAVEFSDHTMEYISYHAILSSSQLAKERGAYQSYRGSKWDRGLFPIDTLELLEEERGIPTGVSKTAQLDWTPVRDHVAKHGMRNSNCLAIAPTATISNISGSLPSVEPIYKNIYTKSNFSGEFTVINHRLVSELKKRGLWNHEMLEKIKHYDGSIQQISEIPASVRTTYKEVFEIDPNWIIRHAAYRGKWIDQSQSINLFTRSTSGRAIADMYLTAWRLGLKTTYYLRSLGASSIEKSTLDVNHTYEEPVAAAASASASPPPLKEPAHAHAHAHLHTHTHTHNAPGSSAAARKPNVYIADDAICEACE
jgi:ribonucleoside-diphosphate reductase alpha chain